MNFWNRLFRDRATEREAREIGPKPPEPQAASSDRSGGAFEQGGPVQNITFHAGGDALTGGMLTAAMQRHQEAIRAGMRQGLADAMRRAEAQVRNQPPPDWRSMAETLQRGFMETHLNAQPVLAVGKLKRFGTVWLNPDTIQAIDFSPRDGCGCEALLDNGDTVHLNHFDATVLRHYLEAEGKKNADLERMAELTPEEATADQPCGV